MYLGYPVGDIYISAGDDGRLARARIHDCASQKLIVEAEGKTLEIALGRAMMALQDAWPRYCRDNKKTANH